ncbi:hypothetical protein GCM10009717_01390 [Agromyces allii]|uniref:Uncharacterized protein n=1 Tax=Agromyces allii TaxID=393607 RepID=A0ABN2PYY9_9MICO
MLQISVECIVAFCRCRSDGRLAVIGAQADNANSAAAAGAPQNVWCVFMILTPS